MNDMTQDKQHSRPNFSSEREKSELAHSAKREKNQGKTFLNVPPLRFPEFSEPWEQHLTTDYFEFKNGLNPDVKRFGTGVKFISVMDILNNRYISYDRIISSVEPKGDDLKDFGVNYGDILFQRSSETLEDVGRANVYLDKRTAIFGGFVIRGKKIGNYDPLFFRYLLTCPTVRKRIIVKGAGAQHFNIGQDGLSKVHLSVPSEKEQKRISDLLNLIDERIETQSKLIEQLQSLMGGIMVAHYNNCEKQVVQIKELGDNFTVMNLSKDNLTDEGNDCVLYGELFTTYHCTISEIKSKTNLTTGLTFSQSNDLLFPSSTTVDAVSLIAPSAITVPNVVLGGDMFGLHINERYSNVYLAFLFNYILKQRLAKYAQGSTIIHLHFNDICNAKIEVPNLTDQLTFVELSSKVQQKIATEISMLANLQALKSYLLQQMFI